MVIGLLDDVPVTGGAFRRFDGETAELKRIWTAAGIVAAGWRGACSRVGGGDRRAWLPSRLPDDRGPSARGRGPLPRGRLPEADRPLPAEGEVYPDGVPQGYLDVSRHLRRRRTRGLRLASRGVAAHTRPPAGSRRPVLGRSWSGPPSVGLARLRHLRRRAACRSAAAGRRSSPRWLAGRPDAVLRRGAGRPTTPTSDWFPSRP